jgi:hypothetical protein
MDTTYEEAQRCPRCSQPGKFVKAVPINNVGVQRGTKVETYECVNERCEYGPSDHPVLGRQEGQRWGIQVNPDGSIPQKGTRDQQRKEYDIDRVTTDAQRQRARDMLAQQYQQSVAGDPRPR